VRFLVVGAAGGLGSFLSRKLRDCGHEVHGIDVIDGPTVDSVVPMTQSISCFCDIISDLFTRYKTPWSVIISIAVRGRSRSSTSYEIIHEDIQELICLNSLLMIKTAECLSRSSRSFDEESHIINIGSVLSDKYSSKESPFYGASKAAAKSLVRDLAAISLKDNICINSISPALLFRNSLSLDYLKKHLNKYSSYISPTAYVDIYKLIEFISLSGIKSLRGKDIVLDYGLEDIEGFDLIATVCENNI